MFKDREGKLFIVSAPSGAGKTTLVDLVLNNLKPKIDISKVITYTTKDPRKNELNGIDYHFITRDDFEAKISQNFFIEWSCAYGNYYGSPRFILDELKNMKSYIAILDINGAQSIKNIVEKAILVWIDVPNLSDLESRLLKRGDSISEIEKRLNLAKNERVHEKINQIFTYKLINDDLKRATTEIESLISYELGLLDL